MASPKCLLLIRTRIWQITTLESLTVELIGTKLLMRKTPIDTVQNILQKAVQIRPISMGRFNQPKLCDNCSQPGSTEVLEELGNVIAVRRYCDKCLAAPE